MNALAVAEPHDAQVLADEASLVRRVLSWMATAHPHERAEAVNALGRALLHCDLPAEARAQAEIGLNRALDDPEPCVRRALAEALASARTAPRHIVLALARDVSEVSRAPLAHSPLLGDADLVDCIGYGDSNAQAAVARRATLSPAVAAALADIGERGAVLALIGNVDVELGKGALWRVLERFSDDAGVRERLAERPRLPAALRAAIVAATTADVSRFAAQPQRRADRISRDGREQAFVAIAADCPTEERAELVAWLRGAGHLTVALLVRALACGDVALFSAALADTAQLPPARVAGWLRDPASFAALYRRAKLPPHLAPAFHIAVACALEAGAAPGVGVNHALTTQILHAVEARKEPALAQVVALLWRLAAEGARADARDYAETAPLESTAVELAPPPVLVLNVVAGNENFAPPVALESLEPVADAAAA